MLHLTRRRLLAASAPVAAALAHWRGITQCDEREVAKLDAIFRQLKTEHGQLRAEAEQLKAALTGGSHAAGATAAPSDRARPRKRVLVTGFHDWRELEANLWRCRDNPSCRLLYGPPSVSPPLEKAGPLVRALREAHGHDAEFCFQGLPVIWGTAAACDLLGFDLVVHMGLGVYDSTDTILLESGAYNERRGKDALGHVAGPALEAGAPQVLHDGRTAANVSALAGATLAGGHALRAAEARPANTYICNETNWRALKAVRRAADPAAPAEEHVRLQAAYFVHLPYAAEGDEGHEKLAASVAELIGQMLRRLD